LDQQLWCSPAVELDSVRGRSASWSHGQLPGGPELGLGIIHAQLRGSATSLSLARRLMRAGTAAVGCAYMRPRPTPVGAPAASRIVATVCIRGAARVTQGPQGRLKLPPTPTRCPAAGGHEGKCGMVIIVESRAKEEVRGYGRLISYTRCIVHLARWILWCLLRVPATLLSQRVLDVGLPHPTI